MANKTQSIGDAVTAVQKSHGVVGREEPIAHLMICLRAGKHVLLEGPVGVGKTHLVSAVCTYLDQKTYRVDGDARFTEQKLTGWFDPPDVLKHGYSKKSFFEGPLTQSMNEGAILFINELNRMPENVQNVLLPSMDERTISLPRVGIVNAKAGFSIVATMNPRDFVATTHISEALLDRFELILLDYQSEEEETEIVRLTASDRNKENKEFLDRAIDVVRATRSNAAFKRGASVRAATSIYDLARELGTDDDAFAKACQMALATRVELSDDGMEGGMERVLEKAKKKERA